MNLEPEHDGSNDSDEDESADAISLEELSQTYAKLLSKSSHKSDQAAEPEDATADSSTVGLADGESPPDSALATSDSSEDAQANLPPTPRSILEAILFVGRPDGGGITAAEIAGLMRGVEEAEIADLVADLNEIYQQHSRAFEIVDSADGFRMSLAPRGEQVRDRFYGRVRTVSLSQAAIDCLALIAYQPGISRQQLDEQRGQPSGGVLNQLVRRQLIEIHREVVNKKSITHYHPTEKLVQLAGLSSLEDLPQVEEFE